MDEYQKYFEKDKALERRFQTVIVDEPSELDTISILRGLKEKYENHHKVRIKDDAIISAVQLSTRYITDRFLPDKAIDLMDEAAARAEQILAGDRSCYAVTPNAEIAYEALHDEKLRALINGADLVLPDGAGVVLASKLLKTPLKQKVAGVDFADRLLSILEKTGGGLFLLGSKPGVAELAAQKMTEKHPKLYICGMNDGYFKDEAPVIEKINAAKPDVLFVCLGAPKQELFMKNHLDELHIKLMIGLGGSLDSFAGTVKRAPKWMIRCNLEWLYRLIKEPKRFGRMLRLPKYLFAVLGKRIRG